MDKKRIRIILKSGTEFVMTCENIECRYNKFDGELVGINYNGATTNIPLYLDLSHIAAVLQENSETEVSNA